MKNVPMRFGGYTFGHNPAKLRIEDAANIVSLVTPCMPADSLHLGFGLRVIRGEGELCGADCIRQFCGLYALYERGEKGLLLLPHMPPMTAYLRELRLIAEPTEDVVGISFTFIEARGEQSAPTPERVCTVAADGGNLWDIAYRYDKSIDSLVRLNPQIRDIAELNAGEKVRLC